MYLDRIKIKILLCYYKIFIFIMYLRVKFLMYVVSYEAFLYNCNRKVRCVMVKIIFSDFDYTMLNYYSDKNYFDDYQIAVLKKVKSKNIKFCIVTGRCVGFFEQFPNLLEVVDYIIGSNGACIYDVQNKSYIYQKNIDNDVLDKLIGYAVDNKHSFLLNCLDKRYYYGNWTRVNAFKYEEGKKYDCEQFILSFDKKYSDDVAKCIEYLNNIIVNNATNWGEEYSLDINVKGISKGNSIDWLCDYLNIEKDDTICFGDGANDLSMFNSVGKSISVGNAMDNVKAQADEIALNCEDYGIYKYIEDNILK